MQNVITNYNELANDINQQLYAHSKEAAKKNEKAVFLNRFLGIKLEKSHLKGEGPLPITSYNIISSSPFSPTRRVPEPGLFAGSNGRISHPTLFNCGRR